MTDLTLNSKWGPIERVDLVREDVKDAIRRHAGDDYPNEACGFILGVGNKQKMMRCRNLSDDPRNFFRMGREDMAIAEQHGKILAYYHSHPNRPPVPSEADKTESENHRIPCIIVGWPTDAWDCYTPTGWRAALTGRPFVYGVLDCYALVKDYYDEVLSIELPEVERPVEKELDVREFVDQCGFERVGDLRIHDVILHQIMLSTGNTFAQPPDPNHCSVYVGDGQILHHLRGRLSCRHPYVADQGYYAKTSYGIYRHKDL